jgi:hypothetical protein
MAHRGGELVRDLVRMRRAGGLPSPEARARCNIGRGIRHREEDDDFPTWLALESAVVFLHGLFAGRAQRCHAQWERLYSQQF